MDLKETTISISWSTADVKHQAQQRGITITQEQACDVLNALEHNHDACIGISWDVIDVHLDQYS